jgi:hypothetical protein
MSPRIVTPRTNAITYRGFTIVPRTFQIHGSRRWTLDVVIASRIRQRAFSGAKTFRTEPDAIRGCHLFGRRIIDGLVPDCPVDDLL